MSHFIQTVGRAPRTGYAHRKYAPGPLLTTFEQIVDCAKRGSWIFHGGRAVHPSWINNFQVRAVEQRLKAGSFRLAIRNKNVPLVFTAVWVKPGVWDDFAAWVITCHEIPHFLFETNTNMAGVMSMCHAKARSLNHWGPVRVQFEKEMP